ncbi:hypothetical protein CRM22_010600 [Opisthorchis felineus]|uniref:BZIP domain-containing protein n=1 Tax=Opisthorchis felineus TaxID=147828 RepID=A0A4S2KWN7_OPIFE|nr:hypothetical protein CRM22_010600 [Opisthorchis felineus]
MPRSEVSVKSLSVAARTARQYRRRKQNELSELKAQLCFAVSEIQRLNSLCAAMQCEMSRLSDRLLQIQWARRFCCASDPQRIHVDPAAEPSELLTANQLYSEETCHSPFDPLLCEL